MSEYGDLVQKKCLDFCDRIIKLNDYLLKQESLKEEVKSKKKRKSIPVYLQSVSAICNQLLRAGTGLGANNAEATNAVSEQDFRANSYIALMEV